MLPAHILGILVANENRRIRIRQDIVQRREMRNSIDFFQLHTDQKFIDNFRLNKELARNLLDAVLPHLEHNNHPSSITGEMKVFTALSFYATGSYQRTIGNSFTISMSQQSVSNCIHEVTRIICDHMAPIWIKFPQAPREKNNIKHRFMQATNFPGVIGAIDCTHVAILAPKQEEHNFVNRKGYHSKNVQIVCDYDLRILSINPRHAGATHDSFIWRLSRVKTELERCYNEGDRNSWLLGDSGYPLQPWLMVPFQNAAPNSPEARYNQGHALARNCIERCNGVLKTRFRCLLNERRLRYDPEVVGNIITACAVLHNMCITANMDLPPINNVEPENRRHIGPVHPPILQQDIMEEGRATRDNIVHRYFRN